MKVAMFVFLVIIISGFLAVLGVIVLLTDNGSIKTSQVETPTVVLMASNGRDIVKVIKAEAR